VQPPFRFSWPLDRSVFSSVCFPLSGYSFSRTRLYEAIQFYPLISRLPTSNSLQPLWFIPGLKVHNSWKHAGRRSVGDWRHRGHKGRNLSRKRTKLPVVMHGHLLTLPSLDGNVAIILTMFDNRDSIIMSFTIEAIIARGCSCSFFI
jgi:hypothetical protein